MTRNNTHKLLPGVLVVFKRPVDDVSAVRHGIGIIIKLEPSDMLQATILWSGPDPDGRFSQESLVYIKAVR